MGVGSQYASGQGHPQMFMGAGEHADGAEGVPGDPLQKQLDALGMVQW